MSSVPDRFVALIAQVTAPIQGLPLGPDLASALNKQFPAEGAVFREIETLCRQGCEEGWLCAREQGGIRFGRPVKPGPATQGYSVDVVLMDTVVGPHHAHPGGEIDMIMPLDPTAQFDGAGRGWMVYPPNSAHRPTVTGGKALILYLLPEGAIEFTRG